MSTPLLNPRVRFKTPAVCHKSLPPPSDVLPPALPPDVSGFCLWNDPDPLNPAYVSTTAVLHLVDPAGRYEGQSPEPTNFIRCILKYDTTFEVWDLQMWLHGLRVPPEDFEFYPFNIDPTKPFDTGLQSWYLPGNFLQRQARFRF